MRLRKKTKTYSHRFVDHVPEQLEQGVLYVSIRYASAVHLCFCGCGSEVVTPISPSKWRITFDGETVSLVPSVGSWSLACQSHYWLSSGRIGWARKWSTREIGAARERDGVAANSTTAGASRKESRVSRWAQTLLGRADEDHRH